jgi:hypothetical protein
LSEHMREKNGEHPFGDAGQMILFLCFMVVWVGDSFFLRVSTFASDHLPLSIRLLAAAFVLIMAIYLAKEGHSQIGGEDKLVMGHGFFISRRGSQERP